MKAIRKAAAKRQPVYSLLVVTLDKSLSKLIAEMLPPEVFSPVVFIDDAQEARRVTADLPPDIIIVDAGPGFETETAASFAQLPSTVILILPSAIFDEASAEVEQYGIVSLAKPLDSFLFYMMLKAACAM